MNIIKDDNWYTVYSKDGVYIKCLQDAGLALYIAKEIDGSFTTSKHYIGPPSTAEAGETYFKRDNSFIHLFYITIIILLIIVIFLTD